MSAPPARVHDPAPSPRRLRSLSEIVDDSLMNRTAPRRRLLIICGAIFVMQSALFFFMPDMRGLPRWQEATIQGGILLLLLLPLLYRYVLHPSTTTIHQLEALTGNLEEKVRSHTEELESTIRRMERQAEEIEALNEFGEFLQSSTSLSEAYDLASTCGERIFTHRAGVLYVLSDSRNYLEPSCHWRSDRPPEIMQPDECWGLRRGTVYEGSASTFTPTCRHFGSATGSSFCLPLIARGETIGLLHLHGGAEATLGDGERRMAIAFGEQISAGIASLRLQEALRAQAIRDPLTGLYNRRYMEESLDRELARARRREHSIAIVMLDLDQFKRFNDTHGHEAGDSVLREVGLQLRQTTRNEDIACRFGGEEFVLILPEIDRQDALEAAERVRARVADMRCQLQGEILEPVTISLGIAVHPDHGDSSQALLQAADKALYAAKATGKDRAVLAADDTGSEPRGDTEEDPSASSESFAGDRFEAA